MNKKITLLFLVIVLLGSWSSKVHAQILLQEGFEKEGTPLPPFPVFPPAGWASTGTDSCTCISPTNNSWTLGQSNVPLCVASSSLPIIPAFKGGFMAGFNAYNYHPSDSGLLISPAMDFSVANATYDISFYVYVPLIKYLPPGAPGYPFPANTAGHDTLQVFIGNGTNLSSTDGDQLLMTIEPNDSDTALVHEGATMGRWEEKTISVPAIPGMAGQNMHLKFKAIRDTAWSIDSLVAAGLYTYPYDSTDYDMYIDSVTVIQHIACDGVPSTGIKGPTSVCGGVYFLLQDTAYSVYNTGITYQWQSRTSGIGFYNNVTIGALGSYLFSTIGVSTDFRLITTCVNSHLSDTSDPFTVTVNPFYNCYCGPNQGADINPTQDPTGNYPGTPEIDSVTIPTTTFNSVTPDTLSTYVSTTTTYNRYQAYPDTGNTTCVLQLGTRYTLAGRFGLGATVAAWIDYDRSQTFDPSGFSGPEYIPLTNPTSNPLLFSGTFVVPATAHVGKTGLRIRSVSSGSGSACSAMGLFATNGETEDYVITIAPPNVNDLTSYNVFQPLLNSEVCANTCLTVSTVVQNVGSASQAGYPVYASYTGPASGTIFTVSSAPVGSFKFDTVSIGCISFPVPGTYTIKTYTSLSNDANRANDTAYSTIIVNAPPSNPVVIPDTVCAGNADTISVVPSAGVTHLWYNAPNFGSIVYVGDTTIIDSLVSNTTFYISSLTPGVPAKLNTVTLSSATSFNVNAGAMFDDSAAVNLTIDSFAARFGDTGRQAVSVYYRPYSYVGYELNAGSWTLLGTATVTVPDTINSYSVNVHNPIALTAGSWYGFYLDYRAGVSPGGTSGATFADVNMKIRMTGNTGTGQRNAFLDTVQNAVFNGSVFYHMGGSSCESSRIPITAAVGRPPVIDHLFEGSYCQNDTLLYLDANYNNENAGAAFSWVTPTGPATTPVYHATVTGTYIVTVVGHCTVSDTVYDSVLPAPALSGINSTNSGLTYHFSPAGAFNVSSYYWTFGDGSNSTLQSPTYTYHDYSNHTVTLQVSNLDCPSISRSIVTPVGLATVISNRDPISLYPNPANTILTITGADDIVYKDLVIINTLGDVVYRGSTVSKKSETIDISKLVPGNYILRVTTTEGMVDRIFGVTH